MNRNLILRQRMFVTGNTALPHTPEAAVCPACGGEVYRLSLDGQLARWWARWTRRWPFACATCGWQGGLRRAAAEVAVIDQLPWFRARAPGKRKEPSA